MVPIFRGDENNPNVIFNRLTFLTLVDLAYREARQVYGTIFDSDGGDVGFLVHNERAALVGIMYLF